MKKKTPEPRADVRAKQWAAMTEAEKDAYFSGFKDGMGASLVAAIAGIACAITGRQLDGAQKRAPNNAGEKKGGKRGKQ